MINEFKKYNYFKKSDSERKNDEIVDSLCRKLWKDSGYATAFYLGSINQLKYMAQAMRETDYLSKKDILRLIGTYKDNNDASDEIKELVEIILEEFTAKEN